MPAIEGASTVYHQIVELRHLSGYRIGAVFLRGLYFAGGSVHPGGGIPLVVLSGKIAALLIAEDYGLR